MKKQELIHLHGLLAQVENQYQQETGNAVEHEDYGRLGVDPTSIHKSKTDHKEAVFALATRLTTAMESEDSEETVAVSAD